MGNNFLRKTRNMENCKQRFSIRKFNVGVASVLLGLTFLGVANTQEVKADSINGSQNLQLQKSDELNNTNQSKNIQTLNNDQKNRSSDNKLSSQQLNSNTESVNKDNVNQLKKDGVLYNNADAQNQIIIYTEPSKGLVPVNQENGQYKFSDGMKVVGRVFSGYYQKDDSVYTDHNANTFETARDELVKKDNTGNGKLTLNIGQIAPDYSNYEFDLDFSKQFDSERTSEFKKGANEGQVEFNYHKVLNDSKNSAYLKNTTYQLFIKPKDQPTLKINSIHDHSNETLLNWYSNGEGTEHDTYLGSTVVDDYSMGVGTYVNTDLRKAHPDIPIDAQATKYALSLSEKNNAGWKFEVNGSNDGTFGPNGFMPANTNRNEAVFDFGKLPADRFSINRGYLNPGKGSTNFNAIPEATAVSGYTDPNRIPLFIELGNGKKITDILALTGKIGEAIPVKSRVSLPDGAIFDPTSSELPATYTFDKNGSNYNKKDAVLQTAIRTDNVAYLTNNPNLEDESNLHSNNAAIVSQDFQWNPTWKENIHKYLQSHPIKTTVTESIYINGKLYKEVKQQLNRTITFEKTYGLNAIYKNPDDPKITRAFGPWKSNDWQKINNFNDLIIELPKNAYNIKANNGEIKDGKLSNVALLDENDNPINAVVNISYEVTPSKDDHKGETTKPVTPSKDDHKGEATKPVTPSKDDHKGEATKPVTPSKDDHKGEATKPVTPSKDDHKGETTKPVTPSKDDHKGEANKPVTPSKDDHKGEATKPVTPLKENNGTVSESKQANNHKETHTLPQTGKKHTELSEIIGLALVTVGGLFGLLVNKKRD